MSEIEELHQLVVAYMHAEAEYQRLMLIFPLPSNPAYEEQLVAAKAARDAAEEAWRRAGAKLRGVG